MVKPRVFGAPIVKSIGGWLHHGTHRKGRDRPG
jgi:hypothetical protein